MKQQEIVLSSVVRQKTRHKRYIPQPVIELVEKMGIIDPDKSIYWDVECGLHSGLPPCCIMFYVTIWRLAHRDMDLFPPDEMGGRLITAGHAIFYHWWDMISKHAEQYGEIGYVPCHACYLARNFVKVKSCDCNRKRIYPLLHKVEEKKHGKKDKDRVGAGT